LDLNEWFEKGLTTEEYISSMKTNKEGMVLIYERFSLEEGFKAKLEVMKQKNLRVIVLTEDWCGDAMLNNPVLLRIAEAAEIEVRFVLRDQNLELMDQYLTNGTSRAIPIFIFIDEQGNEAAVWGPRAPEVQALVDKGRASLPNQDAPDFKEKQMSLYRGFSENYQSDASIWKTVASSILATAIK
jgi:hypothetical protein